LRRAGFVVAVFLLLLSLRIPEREALAFDQKIQQASSDPTNAKNIHETQKILATAKIATIKISPNTLAQAGQKFVDALPNNPAAINAVTAFLNYRSSFLNADVSSSLLHGMEDHPLPEYNFKHRGSEPWPDGEGYGWVPSSQAARVNMLGNNENANEPVGEAFVRLKGGNLVLDGMEMKNVILENVRVYYYGWAVSIENVSFVNCEFKIAPKPNANVEKLINAVLTSRSVTFAASGATGPPNPSELYSAPPI
jgi:hypothetical protein